MILLELVRISVDMFWCQRTQKIMLCLRLPSHYFQ